VHFAQLALVADFLLSQIRRFRPGRRMQIVFVETQSQGSVEQIKILFLKNFEDFYTHRRE
jgi:hypothetical protein